MPTQAEGHTCSTCSCPEEESKESRQEAEEGVEEVAEKAWSSYSSTSTSSSTSYAYLYPLQRTRPLHRRLPTEEHSYHYALGGTSTATTSRVPTSAALPAYSTST